MIAIGVDSSIVDKFNAIKKKIVNDADMKFRQRALIMFRDLVTHSPQWSGDFASNWRMTMNPNTAVYRQSDAKVLMGGISWDEARKMGDMSSIAGTLNAANNVKVNYDKPLYFVNKTPITFMNTSPPEVVGEFGKPTKVRPENLVDGRVALGSYLKAKYSV